MLLPPIPPTDWPPAKIWPCVLSIMSVFFNATTVEILTEADVTPVLRTSQWSVFLTRYLYAPRRHAFADLLVVARNIENINIDGRYHRVIAVTDNINGSLILWSKKRLNDALIVAASEEDVTSYTWYPYRSTNCWTGVKLEFFAKCVGDKWTRKNMYPIKTPTNFRGCPVVYSSFWSQPDIDYDFKTGEFNGREVSLMQIIAESVNLTIKMLPFSMDFWSEEEGSHRHGIRNGIIDFAFSSMTIDSYIITYAEPLPCHNDQPLVWFLPRAKPKSNASNIYSGFSVEMWISVIATLFLTGAVAILMSTVERSRWIWLNLVAALVASPLSETNSTPITAFMFIFQIYSMHIAWFYQSCLLGNLFNVPMERQVESPGEAADRGYTAILLGYMTYYFNNTDHEMWRKIFRKQNRTYWLGSFYDELVDGEPIYLLGNQHQDGYRLREKYHQNLNTLTYTKLFITNPVAAYGIPNSPLTDVYTRQMGHAIQSGVFEHFSNLERYFSDSPPVKSTGTAKVLTLETLEGAFYILGVFLGFALFVFIIEVVFYYGSNQFQKCYKRCRKILPDRKPRKVVHPR